LTDRGLKRNVKRRLYRHRGGLLLSIFFVIQWALLFSPSNPTWDAGFYYAYARSIVFDGDLRIDNDLQLSYPTASTDFVAKAYDQVQTESGRVTTLFALGSAIVWIPWLAVIRLASFVGQLRGWIPSNLTGYEWYFTLGTTSFSVLLGWLAFYLGYRVTRRELGQIPSLGATVTLLFASPLLYYLNFEPLYAHATAACAAAAIVYFWSRHFMADFTPSISVMLGGLIGLSALVRWQQVIYLALPVSTVIQWWLNLDSSLRRSNRGKAISSIALVGLAALVTFSPQFMHWRILYGRLITIPQGASFLNWQAPYWQPTLFSTFRGLLPWFPIFFPALVGLFVQIKKRSKLVIPLLAVLLLAVYVNSSTRDWFAGGGYGPRRFTSEVAILIIGYAGLIEVIAKRYQIPLLVAAGLGLVAHQWVLLRFGLREMLGGRVVSMHPAFEWQDESYAVFFRGIVERLRQAFEQGIDFFIWPSSPIDTFRSGNIPIRQFSAMVAVLAFGFIVWLLVRRIRINARIRSPAITIPLLLLFSSVDLWILLFA